MVRRYAVSPWWKISEAMFRAAVIGLGRVGSQYDEGQLVSAPRSHVGAILGSHEFQLAAACDSCSAARSQFEQDWCPRAPAFANLGEALSGGPLDVVAVAVPTAEHYDVLCLVLPHKPRAIFCEKPFCASSTEAEEVLRIANQSEVLVLANYHRRWDRRLAALKRELADKGPPVKVVVNYCKGLWNYGSHVVDLLAYLFGPVQAVHSATLDARHSDRDDPSYSAILKLQGGADAHLIGHDDVDYELFEVEAYYSKELVRIESGGQEIRVFQASQDRYFKGYANLAEVPVAFGNAPVHGLSDAYADLAAYLSGAPRLGARRQPGRWLGPEGRASAKASSTGESAIATLRILEAIQRAAR